VTWTDPERTSRGLEVLNNRAGQLLDNLPDFVFTAAEPVRVSRGLGHLSFIHGVPDQPPAITGYDVALVRDGRIARLYTLLTAES
jgi:1-acyl-sn-glycerol-3-phosphate acyltransferase